MVMGLSMQEWHCEQKGSQNGKGGGVAEEVEMLWNACARTLASSRVPATTSDEIPVCSVMDEATEGNGC
jgi:hypothetical protein